MPKKMTIEEMQEIAKSREGKCLSKNYTDWKTNLRWQCKEDHIWSATPNNVKRGTWCPVCSVKKRNHDMKLCIEDMQELAKSKGGKCLSKKYVNAHTKLKWQCKEGHEWGAIPSSIKKGSWCPTCAGVSPLSIKDMHELAKRRGGKCLSEKYVNIDTKLRWQCKEGHEWETTPGTVKSGRWCPKCGAKKSADKRRGNIKDLHELAKRRGGKCLSEKYVNIDTKLRWQCKEGHEWETTPYTIMKGSWCPTCTLGISERICRGYLEALFGKKFPKLRPKWLINNNGNQMELDGYNKKLNLAFEYQGIQHFEYTSFFHIDEEDFKKRSLEDVLKRELCENTGVVMIEIPYYIEYDEIFGYIIKRLKEKNVKIPENAKEISYRLLDVYSPEFLKEMNELAKSRGGKCLSKKYVNAHTKLKWKCKEGHEWGAKPNAVKSGSWCPTCAGVSPLSIKDMHELAKRRGGKCLSEKYVNIDTKLRWQCKEGHEWETTPGTVKSGSWCPKCARKKRADERRGSIEEMQEIAKSRGGRCLSKKYVSSQTKLKWKCKEGHEWRTTPYVIKRGSWCPTCARSHRKKR